MEINKIFSSIKDKMGKKKNLIKNMESADIQEMIEKASYLQHVEHKNPSAYILGFLATKGGTQKLVTEEGNKELYEQIIEKALPLVDIEASVFPEDVIRYSRLWLQLYSKKSRV